MTISFRFASACGIALLATTLASGSVVTEYTMRNDLPGLLSEVRDFGTFANRASLSGDLSGEKPTASSIMQGWRVYGRSLANPIIVNFQN